MKKILVLLLTTTFCFSQKQPQLDFKIDVITWSDSIPNKRVFKIDYHLKNVTTKKLKYFKATNSIYVEGKPTLMPRFKIYQNKNLIECYSILNTNKKGFLAMEKENFKTEADYEKASKEATKNTMGMDMDSLISDMEKLPNEEVLKKLKKRDEKDILNSLMTFEPQETKKFSVYLYWDKKIYYKQNDKEFFIENDSKYSISMSLNLKKEDCKNRLSDEKFKEIMQDKTINTGEFFTPKAEINFKLNEKLK